MCVNFLNCLDFKIKCSCHGFTKLKNNNFLITEQFTPHYHNSKLTVYLKNTYLRRFVKGWINLYHFHAFSILYFCRTLGKEKLFDNENKNKNMKWFFILQLFYFYYHCLMNNLFYFAVKERGLKIAWKILDLQNTHLVPCNWPLSPISIVPPLELLGLTYLPKMKKRYPRSLISIFRR